MAITPLQVKFTRDMTIGDLVYDTAKCLKEYGYNKEQQDFLNGYCFLTSSQEARKLVKKYVEVI